MSLDPLQIGDTFRRLDPQGDEYDVVRCVGVAKVDETYEPIVSPVQFGQTIQVDPSEFFRLYSRHGVKQLEQPSPNASGRYGYGPVAGRGRREATEVPSPPVSYADLLEAEPLDDLQARLDALGDAK